MIALCTSSSVCVVCKELDFRPRLIVPLLFVFRPRGYDLDTFAAIALDDSPFLALWGL